MFSIELFNSNQSLLVLTGDLINSTLAVLKTEKIMFCLHLTFSNNLARQLLLKGFLFKLHLNLLIYLFNLLYLTFILNFPDHNIRQLFLKDLLIYVNANRDKILTEFVHQYPIRDRGFMSLLSRQNFSIPRTQ